VWRSAPVQNAEEEGGVVELTIEVRNTGAMAAADVLQVYLEPPAQLMERPRRSLVAFQRVPLEPGESQRLRLAIPLRRLACFDPDRDRFVVEAGPHRLVVAPHAEAPGPAVVLELEGRVLGP
jgi:beta-glucosidase